MSQLINQEVYCGLERRMSAVVCSTDLIRSQEFYEQKLGLKLSPETIKNHLLFECGEGTSLLVYGRPGTSKADHTQVRFWSNDVEADVSELWPKESGSRSTTSRLSRPSIMSQRLPGSGSRRGSRTRTGILSLCFSRSNRELRQRVVSTYEPIGTAGGDTSQQVEEGTGGV